MVVLLICSFAWLLNLLMGCSFVGLIGCLVGWIICFIGSCVDWLVG